MFCLVFSVVSTAKRVCFRLGTRMATDLVLKEAPTISFWLSSVSESMILAMLRLCTEYCGPAHQRWLNRLGCVFGLVGTLL